MVKQVDEINEKPEVKKVDKRHKVNIDLQVEYLRLLNELEEAKKLGEEKLVKKLTNAIHRNDADFYQANIGLTYDVARPFFIPGDSNGDDFLQDAALGLMQARRKWDPTMGVTFATFSRPYMSGTTQRGVRTLDHNSLSQSDFVARKHVIDAIKDFEKKKGYVPSDEEVRAITGHSLNLIGRVRKGKTTSLDTPVGDGQTTIGDFMSDKADDREADLSDLAWWDKLCKSTKNLTAEEVLIIGRRDGYTGSWRQSLVELASDLGMGREPVRRSEVRARNKSGIAPVQNS